MSDLLARFGVVLLASGAVSCSASSTAQNRPDTAPASAAAAAAPGGASAVLAEGAGLTVSLAEIETRMGAERLMDLRQREYEARKDALDALLEEKLVEKEAAAQGLTVEKLREREVVGKAAKPERAEVEQLYAQNQRRFAGVPKEQALLTVELAVASRNREQRATVFRRELVKKHGVKIRLEPPRYEVAVPGDAPALGSPKAGVTIVEFADYQCPFCHQAQLAVEEILKRYTGKVRFVHRDYPLDSIHPRATPAARASRCAGEQGKFWEFHRGLLASGADLSDAGLKARAETLRLNLTSFSTCLAQPGGEKPIQDALADGNKLGVNSTPTFFINGRRLVGARSFTDLAEIIEEELDRVGR
jgi:protein-disulfide isomerase